MLADRTVTKAGFQLVIRSGSLSKAVQQAVLEGLSDIGKNYKRQIDKNISLDDHTLQELKKMGHPYATGKPENVPHDDRMVHEQEGTLRKSIKVHPPEESSSRRFTVYVTTDAPEAVWLIYGTVRMRPRRFHEKAFNEIKSTYWDPILSRLKKVNARIEFGASSARVVGR
jgi:hypothetical protein